MGPPGPKLVWGAPRGTGTQAGASPPGKRVSAFCIRASTTPTTWMDDTEAASSWAWSLGQKGVKVSHHLAKSQRPPLWPVLATGSTGPRCHMQSLFSKARRHGGRLTCRSHTQSPSFTQDGHCRSRQLSPLLRCRQPDQGTALSTRVAPCALHGQVKVMTSHTQDSSTVHRFLHSLPHCIPTAKVLGLGVISSLQVRKWRSREGRWRRG